MRLGMPGNHHANWASLQLVIRNVMTQYGSRASVDLNYLIWLPPLDGGIGGREEGEGEDGRMVRAEPGEGEDGRMVDWRYKGRRKSRKGSGWR